MTDAEAHNQPETITAKDDQGLVEAKHKTELDAHADVHFTSHLVVHLKHVYVCGSGCKLLDIELRDDKSFRMSFECQWMGQDTHGFSISGDYETTGNNYYFLNVAKLVNLSGKTYDQGKRLTFELVLLTSPRSINKRDGLKHFFENAWCPRLNSDRAEFDAILMANMLPTDDDDQHCVEERRDDLEWFLSHVRVCKLLRAYS